MLDRYEGLRPKLLQDFTDAEKAAYVEANAAALRELLPADLIFTNHVLLGGPVGAATGQPFRVKAHGSELEYSMRGRPELEEWGRETLAHAEVTYVGSEHIRRVLADVVGETGVVHEVPPGVDVDLFVLEERPAALAALLEAARADPPNPGNAEERLPDEGNAERLEEFLAGDAPTVVYFGKLIEQKGVQVLLEAMRTLDARLVVVGFGPYRAQLEAMAPERTLFTGPLEHRHLVHLLPLADRHGRAVGLPRGVRDGRGGGRRRRLAARRRTPLGARRGRGRARGEYPERFRGLASFTSGDSEDLARKLAAILALSADDHDELRRAARQAVVERWSWHSVAQRLLQPV